MNIAFALCKSINLAGELSRRVILYLNLLLFLLSSRSDFVLCYARDKTSLSDYSSSETVGHVWLESIKKANLHVKDGDVALFKLELTARVAYPKQAATADMDEDDKV